MKSYLRARDTRFSLKPSSAPASEAASARPNAPPCARSAWTHGLTSRITWASPPQVQMEKNSTTPSARRPQSTSFHRARRGPAAAFSSSAQETRGLCCPCYLPVLYGLWLPPMAGLKRVSCSISAVLCVYRRLLDASSASAEAGTAAARARTLWGPFC